MQVPEPTTSAPAAPAEAKIAEVEVTGVAPNRSLEATTSAPETGGTLGIVTVVREGGAGDIYELSVVYVTGEEAKVEAPNNVEGVSDDLCKGS